MRRLLFLGEVALDAGERAMRLDWKSSKLLDRGVFCLGRAKRAAIYVFMRAPRYWNASKKG